MRDKAEIIKNSCIELLHGSKDKAIDIINDNYKFEYKESKTRNYSDKVKMKIYLRDGFIDRYTGDKLVNPGILKVLSNYYPKEFPYQSHWKMSETHIAYWELIPTIDHLIPIAIGGEDCEENWVSTSMLHNSIKSNWSIEQVGWKLFKPGNIEKWDGLTDLFIKLVELDSDLLGDNYIKKWYKISKDLIR